MEAEVVPFGRSEAANDMPVLYSNTRAEPADGGYRFYGHMVFGSLSPVWTRLGIYGQDNTDPGNHKMVYPGCPVAFRGTPPRKPGHPGHEGHPEP